MSAALIEYYLDKVLIGGLLSGGFAALTHGCVTRRKQHRPGIAPNANTTHAPTAGSSAALWWCSQRKVTIFTRGSVETLTGLVYTISFFLGWLSQWLG